MFSLRSVCLSVCMSVWKSCERILTKFLGGVGHGPGTNEFNFGDYPDHRLDPGFQSPKSALTGLLKKLPTDFDEILRRAGMWPRDQLITFWWRSASLSESGSPFRIMIQIWEELPRCQHTQNRCPQCSPNEFNFGDDPDHCPDPGVQSPKSGFTGLLSIMLAFGRGLRSLNTSSLFLKLVSWGNRLKSDIQCINKLSSFIQCPLLLCWSSVLDASCC